MQSATADPELHPPLVVDGLMCSKIPVVVLMKGGGSTDQGLTHQPLKPWQTFSENQRTKLKETTGGEFRVFRASIRLLCSHNGNYPPANP